MHFTNFHKLSKNRPFIPSNIFTLEHKKRTLYNSFYDVNIILIPKPDKESLEIYIYIPILFMNTDVKFLDEMVAN